MANNKLYNDSELIQYFIVNKDLNMSVGKTSAQVAHVAINEKDNIDFLNWYNDNQKKIVLQAHQKDLEKLIEQGFYYIRDNGLTEIEPNSLTCVSLGITTREQVKKYVKRLQLLK